MKKVTGLVLVILMVFIAVPAKSQLKFGVKGGLNISSVHMNSDILKADNVTGFQIGPMIETTIPLIGIGLDAAILYSQKGVDMKTEGTVTSTSMKTDYLDIPVNLKWKFGIPLVKAYLSAGPYVGFRVGGDKIWNVLGEQIKAKNFSAGLNFGVGAELISHFNYGLGLTDNYSSDKFDMKAKNRGWSITAAVLF